MFLISPQAVSNADLVLAPSFDQARDLRHLCESQPPAAIGFAEPSAVRLPFWGPRVWTTGQVGEGLSIQDDDLRPLLPVIQAGLNLYFARAATPEKARCTVMTERVIVPPRGCARPDFTPETHLDDLSSWFFDSQEIAPVRWGTYIMWSDSLAADFYLSTLDAQECTSAQQLSERVSGLPRDPKQSFTPGTVSLHTGAAPHASIQNMTDQTIIRQWCLMTFHQ